MIFVGKKLKDALTSKGKLPDPAIRFHFDSEKSLFRRKDDPIPLFTLRIKGDFRLPLIRFFVTLGAVSVGAALFCRTVRSLCKRS